MPTRRLARTDAERDAALRNGKNRKDAIPPPSKIPYTADTIMRIDLFQPAYRLNYLAVASAKNGQTGFSPAIEQARKQAVLYEQDFIEALNKAIRRGEFPASVRSFYLLDVNSSTLPRIVTESEVTTWGQNINDGETARIAAGGAPITFPSLAQVNAATANFNTLNQQQENAKELYDTAQEQLEAQNAEADKLILKMWNETETAFDEGDKASMRRRARQFGVVYIPNQGETPSPDDFSIMGKATDSTTGQALGDVAIRVVETDTIVITNAQGEYFMGIHPPGTYTIEVTKAGYATQNIPGVVVTAGSITTLNIQLSIAVATGTVSGNVKQMGINVNGASIWVNGFPLLTTTTDINGNYTINNVPAGAQALTAKLPPPSPAMPQIQNTTVMAGAEVNVSFNF